MTEKFTPTDGQPLTAYEREVLTILQEEAAEVIVAASKLLRFGKGNTNPTTGEKNTRELGLEAGDFVAMLEIAAEADLLAERDVEQGGERKRERLKVFLQTAKS